MTPEPLIQLGNGFHWFLLVSIASFVIFLTFMTIVTQEAGAAAMTVICFVSGTLGMSFFDFPREAMPLWIKIYIGAILALGLFMIYIEVGYRIDRARKRRARRASR